MAVWYHEKSTDESPDRDFKPVSWLPSPQGIYEKVYVSQKFTLCTHSKFRLVEHSTIICNEKKLKNISYSTKNIPLPSHNDYLQRLIERTEKFLHRMRWKAHSFLNPDTTSFTKETYGFKSTKNPPSIEELKDFEDDMLKMIQSVKFKQVNNPFLNRLKENTDHIKNEPKLLIAADKTTNFYKLEPSTYNNMLEKTSRNPTRRHYLRRR